MVQFSNKCSLTYKLRNCGSKGFQASVGVVEVIPLNPIFGMCEDKKGSNADGGIFNSQYLHEKNARNNVVFAIAAKVRRHIFRSSSSPRYSRKRQVPLSLPKSVIYCGIPGKFDGITQNDIMDVLCSHPLLKMVLADNLATRALNSQITGL